MFHSKGKNQEVYEYRNVPLGGIGKEDMRHSRVKFGAAVDHLMQQNKVERLNPNCVLLDNQSTVTIFSNSCLLTNICK
eukprot:13769555-Ditylum_brightwellii.AAC.1